MIDMSVEANIIVQEVKDVVLAPAEAIVDNVVQVAENGEVVRRRVDVGIRGSGLVELRSGVAEGDIRLDEADPRHRLAAKIGARVGNTITLVSGSSRRPSCTEVALLHAGVAQVDETQAYTLIKTAQILAGQIGLVNAIRIRVDDILNARTAAARIEAQTGYKSVSREEANEDLLSAFEIRNVIMYTVVGAILLVASFGTFMIEALLIGLAGMITGWALGYALSRALGSIEFKSPFVDATHLPIYYTFVHYALAGLVTLSASAIAGYLPARKAARVRPVDIIRGAS
ncbi:MAG: FtsX-like permease family protein [Geminicoccaceae bacterium]